MNNSGENPRPDIGIDGAMDQKHTLEEALTTENTDQSVEPNNNTYDGAWSVGRAKKGGAAAREVDMEPYFKPGDEFEEKELTKSFRKYRDSVIAEWTEDEDKALIKAKEEYRLPWKEIDKLFPQRNSNTLRNHYYQSLRTKNAPPKYHNLGTETAPAKDQTLNFENWTEKENETLIKAKDKDNLPLKHSNKLLPKTKSNTLRNHYYHTLRNRTTQPKRQTTPEPDYEGECEEEVDRAWYQARTVEQQVSHQQLLGTTTSSPLPSKQKIISPAALSITWSTEEEERLVSGTFLCLTWNKLALRVEKPVDECMLRLGSMNLSGRAEEILVGLISQIPSTYTEVEVKQIAGMWRQDVARMANDARAI